MTNGAPKDRSTGRTVLIVAAVGCIPAVIIVGILAAIAIPNFLLYQCKAKQSEAKATLSYVRTMEQSFYAENDAYTTDLLTLGFDPFSSDPTYVVGFSDPGAHEPLELIDGSRTNPERSYSSHPDVVAASSYTTAAMLDIDGTPLDRGDLPSTTASEDEATIGAAGDVKGNGSPLDQWTLTVDGTGASELAIHDACR